MCCGDVVDAIDSGTPVIYITVIYDMQAAA